MRKPLVVLVSGAPGAGKTTLAEAIASRLRIPHIPRDEILRGIEMTKGADIDRGGIGIAAYFRLMKQLCIANVSFVTDGTLYKGVSENDIKARLVPIAEVINLHVRAKDEQSRFVAREKAREGWSDDWVEAHREVLDNIYDRTADPLDLGVPLIEVDATEGYEPSLVDLVSRIRVLYPDTRPGLKHDKDKED
jgi:adenylate kinase family enzyme